MLFFFNYIITFFTISDFASSKYRFLLVGLISCPSIEFTTSHGIGAGEASNKGFSHVMNWKRAYCIKEERMNGKHPYPGHILIISSSDGKVFFLLRATSWFVEYGVSPE